MSKTPWDAHLYQDKHAFVWKMGVPLLELLNPQAGERILDVGCGTGQLTAQIAQTGASVVGLDLDEAMLLQARSNYPHLEFVQGNAASFRFAEPFDAVFSNAALHWVLDAEGAVRSMAAALKPGGRLVAELGGQGNVQHILEAASFALVALGYGNRFRNLWYFLRFQAIPPCWKSTAYTSGWPNSSIAPPRSRAPMA